MKRYVGVFTVDDKNKLSNLGDMYSPFSHLPILNVIYNGVQKLVQGLNAHSAMGADELLPRDHKEITGEKITVFIKVFDKFITDKW